MGNKHNKKEKANSKSKYKFNILFVGESGIGTKTSLIRRITKGEFIDTKSDDRDICQYLSYEINNKEIIFYLIDTNGDKENRDIISNNYFKNADCIIMGYDVTNRQTFEEIKIFWYNKIKEINKKVLIYLLGNKIDLKDKIEITENEGKEFADKNNIPFYSISIKNNININNLIENLKLNLKTDLIRKNNGINEITHGKPSKERYKVILLADNGVGTKTSFINAYINRTFDPNCPRTNGASYCSTKIGNEVLLDIWDTPEHRGRDKIYDFFFKDSDVIVLGYDVTNRYSFDNIKDYWYPLSKRNSGRSLIYLLGNKIDLFEQIAVDENEVIKFTKENDVRFFKISCKTFAGIQTFIDDLSNELLKR